MVVSGGSGVAAFDFDGTITRRDTLAPFLRRVGGPGRFAAACAAAAPVTAVRDAGVRRDRAKAILLDRILRGRRHDDLAEVGERHARTIPSGYRDDVLRSIDDHRSRGHRLVLVTASLGVYARPAAAALGFDHVIAVELEAVDGRCTGAMTGPNVRGAEKAVRIRAWLGDEADDVELWAYGNSSGDSAMLAMADHPVWVRRRQP